MTEAPWGASQSGIVIGSNENPGDPPHVAAQNVEVTSNYVWSRCYGIQVVNALDADVSKNTVYIDRTRGACNFTGIRFVEVSSGTIHHNTISNAEPALGDKLVEVVPADSAGEVYCNSDAHLGRVK